MRCLRPWPFVPCALCTDRASVQGCSCGTTVMAEVEETLRRINAHKGVLGVIIISPEGQPIRTTLEDKIAKILCDGLPPIFRQCRSAVRTLDPLNDLTYLRFNCKMYEILIAPTEVRSTPPSRGAPPLLCCGRLQADPATPTAAPRSALLLLPHAACPIRRALPLKAACECSLPSRWRGRIFRWWCCRNGTLNNDQPSVRRSVRTTARTRARGACVYGQWWRALRGLGPVFWYGYVGLACDGPVGTVGRTQFAPLWLAQVSV